MCNILVALDGHGVATDGHLIDGHLLDECSELLHVLLGKG